MQEAAGRWMGISGFRINAVYTPFPYENEPWFTTN